MPAELVAPELEEREKLDVMPSVKEFSQLSKEDLENKQKVLKDKLLMRPGEHNGVYYTWEELKKNLSSGEEAGLFYDHQDSVRNYCGYVKELKADDSKQEVRGDLVLLEEDPYKKLKAGAKWGISPTIDAEKVVKDGQKYAVDPKFHSFSFVLRPAVRDTMLNNEEPSSSSQTKSNSKDNMAQESEETKEELAQKKNELSEKDKQIEELKKELESYKEKERNEFSEKILELEKSIGFTSEANAESRLKELKEMSSEARQALKSAHDGYVQKLQLDQEKSDEEENAAKKKKKYPYPYPQKSQAKMNEGGSDEGSGEESSDENKEELSSKEINKGMLEYMQEMEKQK